MYVIDFISKQNNCYIIWGIKDDDDYDDDDDDDDDDGGVGGDDGDRISH